jgi:hypothetical protein
VRTGVSLPGLLAPLALSRSGMGAGGPDPRRQGRCVSADGTNSAMEYVVRCRERHRIQLDGVCGYCRTVWPCEPFWLAHHVVIRLTAADKTRSQRGLNEKLQAGPVS